MSDTLTWMHSGQIGAPQMNGASGSNGQMLQVLDACLVDGFNSQTVISATKTATTVTLTYGVSHGYVDRQFVTVVGATDTALNGKQRIVSTTANTVTLGVADVAVTTGNITTKISPLNFESIFGNSDTLRRAYRSKSELSTKTVLFLDMSLPSDHGYDATNPAKRAMVSLCEDMQSLGMQINSYSDEKNNYSVTPNGSLFWYQCRNNTKAPAVKSTTPVSWVIVGNGDYFYFFLDWQDASARNGTFKDIYGFGDFPSFAGIADSYNCMWVGILNNNDSETVSFVSNGSKIGGNPTTNANQRGVVVKSADGSGDLQGFVFSTCLSLGTEFSTGLTASINYPNPSTQSILAEPLYIKTTNDARGLMPNLMSIPQNLTGISRSNLDLKIIGDLLIIGVQASYIAINMRV